MQHTKYALGINSYTEDSIISKTYSKLASYVTDSFVEVEPKLIFAFEFRYIININTLAETVLKSCFN